MKVLCEVDVCKSEIIEVISSTLRYVQVAKQWNVSESFNMNIMHMMKISLTSNYLAFFWRNKLPQAFNKKNVKTLVFIKNSMLM